MVCLGPQALSAQSVQPRAGRGARHSPAARADGLRPGGRRRRARRAGGGGLRRLRRAATRSCSSAPAPGGQAGRSMRIENYLGFPTGITGGELAERAVVQANKFGARCPFPRRSRPDVRQGYSVLHLDDGETVTAKCLLIATGRRLPPARRRRLRAVRGPRRLLRGDADRGAAVPRRHVVVVGGGNSAGQAAVYLSSQAVASVSRDPRRTTCTRTCRLTWPGASSRRRTSRCFSTPRCGGWPAKAL